MPNEISSNAFGKLLYSGCFSLSCLCFKDNYRFSVIIETNNVAYYAFPEEKLRSFNLWIVVHMETLNEAALSIQ